MALWWRRLGNEMTGTAAEHFLNKRLVGEQVLTHLKASQKQFKNIVCLFIVLAKSALHSCCFNHAATHRMKAHLSHQTVSSLCASASAPPSQHKEIATQQRECAVFILRWAKARILAPYELSKALVPTSTEHHGNGPTRDSRLCIWALFL